ncbi:MAG TPA: NAD(P)-dependent oxidoreductase [Dongiaceae bacterium]|jgi:uroporphyrin-III C-methyltransferase/precorrin-2 dehydrogenase/sirohydrochlorin ferrochelatase|nr:NAD(P)-dependent oxidoreductase [Dongiaceae bacterium]
MNAFSPPNSDLADVGLAYLPIFIGMRGRTALLIGGGEAALAKLNLLRRAGARVRLVAQGDDGIGEAAAGDRMVVRITEPLAAHHFKDAVLAIDASGDEAVNRVSTSLARAAGVPINVVDRPSLCDFILPAILDRSPIVVAISTGGAAPAVARLIRQKLEAAIPAGFGRVAALAARVRRRVSERLSSPAERAGFWESLFDGPAAELAVMGQMQDAEALAHELIDHGAGKIAANTIHVLRSGPGDPDLLTVRAARLIRMADLIVHDEGVAPAILDLARRDAARISLRSSVPRQESFGLLRRYANEGRVAIYLKAGAADRDQPSLPLVACS